MGLAASRMTMRARVLRNAAADTQEDAPAPDLVSDAEPCWVWSKSRRYVAEGGQSVVVEDLTAVFKKDSPVQAGDTIESIVDRRGAVVMDGPVFVETMVPRSRGAAVDHYAATLRRPQS